MAKWPDTLEIRNQTRICEVDGDFGYFHGWENYSDVIDASPFVGGHPGGTFSRTYGLVELCHEVRRINPEHIKFCDEENELLKTINKKFKEQKDKERG